MDVVQTVPQPELAMLTGYARIDTDTLIIINRDFALNFNNFNQLLKIISTDGRITPSTRLFAEGRFQLQKVRNIA
jgi:hypothetical protein